MSETRKPSAAAKRAGGRSLLLIARKGGLPLEQIAAIIDEEFSPVVETLKQASACIRKLRTDDTNGGIQSRIKDVLFRVEGK